MCIHTPQQNGIAECKNRHILEVARALCFTMHVPKRFWADAIMIVVFLINRMFVRVINYQTPLRMLSQFHSIPSVLNLCLRIFGCNCYIHVHSHSRDKLDLHALKCVFLGYSNSQKGYKCFHPPSGKYYVSMDVQFNECESYFLRMWTWFLFRGRLIVRKKKHRGWKKRGGGFQVRGRTGIGLFTKAGV